MKRITFLITFFVLAISQMSAQDNSYQGKITLSHLGKETSFAYNKMSDAVEAAQDGDTIYLSKGEFEGDFQLNKKIAFIGSGADGNNGTGTYTRYYSGNIVLNLPEGTKLTSRLFDGIYFDCNFTFQSAIDNVIIRKCKTPCSVSINANIQSLYFDRCDISCASNFLGYNNSVKKLIARNCKISDLSMSSSNNENVSSWQFIHCTIDPSNWGWNDDEGNYHTFCPLQGIYTNCIIDNDENNQGYELYDPRNNDGIQAAYINCLFYKPAADRDIFNGAATQDNLYYEAPNADDNYDSKIRNFTKEQLIANNFLGNDGTVVGCLGGKNPFTLKPNIPLVSSTKVHLDRDKKQIQINIKLSSQQ